MIVQLDGKLREYRAANGDDERRALSEQILAKYNVTAALLVLDMSGFSRITKEFGIVHFLAMVQQMQDITAAEIDRFGGKVVKFFSDNCFAFFRDPEQGVKCAISIMQAHDELDKSIATPLHICMGIDYGEFLLIEGSECFGHTVNRACKLGEDIADQGELLVTARTIAAIDNPDQFTMEPHSYLESGIDIDAFLIDIPDVR